MAREITAIGLATFFVLILAGDFHAAQAAGKEAHPAIHKAISQLENAKMVLQKEAARDFEGHRAQAVTHIDQALAELQKALAADKK